MFIFIIEVVRMEVKTNYISANEIKSVLGHKNKEELSDKKRSKYERMAKKYVIQEKLIIAKVTRKTILYIEKNIYNFPNNYSTLKSRIIESCYDILEYVYRANVFQSIVDKKEIIVKIQMLNFYLSDALNKELISYKKFESYTKHLLEIDSMVRSWFKYETSK